MAKSLLAPGWAPVMFGDPRTRAWRYSLIWPWLNTDKVSPWTCIFDNAVFPPNTSCGLSYTPSTRLATSYATAWTCLQAGQWQERIGAGVSASCLFEDPFRGWLLMLLR